MTLESLFITYLFTFSFIDCPYLPACDICKITASGMITRTCPSYTENPDFQIHWKYGEYITIDCGKEKNLTKINMEFGQNITHGDNFNHIRFFHCDMPKGNAIKEIAKKTSTKGITMLTFHTHRELSIMTGEHFKGFKYLTLSNNLIEKLPDHLFENSSLIELDLSHNKLHNLNFLDSLKKLKILNLSHNKIRKIESGAFNSLKNLIKLNLSNNLIEILPDSILHPLKKLKVIDLSYNNIKTNELPYNLFAKQKNLKGFFMRENRNYINILPKKFLADLPYLEVVDLSGLGLEELSTDLLLNTPKIKNIYLNNNKLTSLSPFIFREKKKLKRLLLSENLIVELPAKGFQGLDNMEFLNISFNCIKSVSLDDFVGLPKSCHIDIRENQLKEIELKILQNYDICLF